MIITHDNQAIYANRFPCDVTSPGPYQRRGVAQAQQAPKPKKDGGKLPHPPEKDDSKPSKEEKTE